MIKEDGGSWCSEYESASPFCILESLYFYSISISFQFYIISFVFGYLAIFFYHCIHSPLRGIIPHEMYFGEPLPNLYKEVLSPHLYLVRSLRILLHAIGKLISNLCEFTPFLVYSL
ncbi:hypothetical protein KP509_10G078600 [Ceratopteris richardii]|uniref:Uncharacterized protein n=1 Tax=Ceratopteris richardii TaxID=49495 RepID=A0A8T2U6J5_CERRI|nr:hypothetical protein KP509_10G078600 [Ceratopteris richardii]